jgi:hypothetical protein
MEKAVLEAMNRTEDKKYTLKFQGQSSKIDKTASAVSSHPGVRVIFEEAAVGSWQKSRTTLLSVQKSLN